MSKQPTRIIDDTYIGFGYGWEFKDLVGDNRRYVCNWADVNQGELLGRSPFGGPPTDDAKCIPVAIVPMKIWTRLSARVKNKRGIKRKRK